MSSPSLQEWEEHCGVVAAEAGELDEAIREFHRAGDAEALELRLIAIRKRLAAVATTEGAKRAERRLSGMFDQCAEIAALPSGAPLIRARNMALDALRGDAMRVGATVRRNPDVSAAHQFAVFQLAVSSLAHVYGPNMTLAEACAELETVPADMAIRMAHAPCPQTLEGEFLEGLELYDSRNESEAHRQTAVAFLRWSDDANEGVTSVLNRNHEFLGFVAPSVRKALLNEAEGAKFEGLHSGVWSASIDLGRRHSDIESLASPAAA